MADLTALKARNAARWAAAKLTRGPEFDRVATRLVMSKPRYQALADKTGVPWFVIAVIHEREAGQNFTKSIAQGDPWNEKSVHIPKGRGPFKSFEEAAIDALTKCPPYAAKWKDWSTGGTMTLLEQYNGLGYANKGLPSPYIWSGTDQYKSGKYVADGKFDPSVVDKQLGCAGLIIAMQTIDGSIKFGATPVSAPVQPATKAGTSGAIVATGTVAATQAHDWKTLAVILAGVIVALGIAYLIFRKKD